MIAKRPFDSLGRHDADWLAARYHFSFSGYHDPARVHSLLRHTVEAIDRLDAFTLSLLSNDDVLDVDQDPLGRMAVLVAKSAKRC